MEVIASYLTISIYIIEAIKDMWRFDLVLNLCTIIFGVKYSFDILQREPNTNSIYILTCTYICLYTKAIKQV